MNNSLKNYLEWRFRHNNIPKYHRYCDTWIKNIPKSQLWYYEIEMSHLINNGIYG